MAKITKINNGTETFDIRDAEAVHNSGDETIAGAKTFSSSPAVPTVASTDDSSTKAASTGWVAAKLTAWWNSVKTTVTFSKAQVGLGNVDNTSDADKPISSAVQTALAEKAADNAVVKLAGDQSVSGTKTFASLVCSGTASGAALAAVGMPSNTAIENIMPLENGATYTAPANGYVLVIAYAAAAGNAYLRLTGVQSIGMADRTTYAGTMMQVFVPVKVGTVVMLYCNNVVTGEYSRMRFIYAQGEV